MLSVRIWNLQSDRKATVVKFLENEFWKYRQLEYLAIRPVGRSALRKCQKKGTLIKDSLGKAIQHSLKQDDYIIFVTDPDPQGRRESKTLVDQLRQVVKDANFSDNVFFLPDLQESDKSAIPMPWQDTVSRLRTEVESECKRLRKEWQRTLADFHEVFADTPEEEVIRDFEEALAEVRRERA